MEPIKLKKKPEKDFINLLKEYMGRSGWEIVHMPTSMYSSGWPDKIILHKQWKCHKWVEFKNKGGKLRETQIKRFAQLASCGIDVYVLEGDGTESESELQRIVTRLFQKPNWMLYVPGVIR